MLKSKKSFTLIEIIVVLIIVGILAAIAVPSLFSWIQKSHAPEAALTLKTMADQMDVCLAKGTDAGICVGGIVPPSMGAINTPNFTCSFSAFGGLAQSRYMLAAVFLPSQFSPQNGVTCHWADGSSITTTLGQDVIALCSENGQRTLVGVGIFQGMF